MTRTADSVWRCSECDRIEVSHGTGYTDVECVIDGAPMIEVGLVYRYEGESGPRHMPDWIAAPEKGWSA